MTYLENELSRVFQFVKNVTCVQYVGNCVYGKINDALRLKVQFRTGRCADNYTHFSIKAINTKEGVVDEICINMVEVLGKNPNNGGAKYIWANGDSIGWYGYKATMTDYQILADAVNKFVKVYK